MKHKLTRLLSLALSLVMLFTLVPSAFAAEGDGDASDAEGDSAETNMIVAFSDVEDIIIKPSAADGHIRFGQTDDVQSLHFRGEDGIERPADTVLSVADALAEVCARALPSGLRDAGLEYISYVHILGSQGTVYDGYNTEGDTGAGVAGVQKYYYGNSSASNYRISNIRFVPKTSFTGQATITYYGYYHYTDRDESGKDVVRTGSYSGRICIDVEKQQPGIAYSTDGEPVSFSSEDFSAYSLAVTGRVFKYITFQLPSRTEGALYYNYIDESIYDYAVAAGSRYYRRDTPSIDRVYFVPTTDYSGNVHLDFTGVDSADAPITGTVLIKVTSYGPSHTPRADGPFVYPVKSGRSVSLNTDDFERQCQIELGDEFASFRLASLPAKSNGVLYDDGATTSADHRAAVNQSYAKPENIRFAADSGFTGVVSVPIIVTGAEGDSFDSTLRFDVTKGEEKSEPLHYTVEPEKRVSFIVSDFSDACFAATGYDIQRVHFDSLPSASHGGLYRNVNTPVDANANTYYYKDQLSELSFLASTDFTGSLKIPFTGYAYGYSSSNGRSFSGTVTISSTEISESDKKPIGSTDDELSYSTTGPAVQLNQRDILDVATPALPGAPVSIVLTRPDSDAGRLCLDFVSLSRYTDFNARQSYPISDVSRISFLPKAGYSGLTRIQFTASDAKGNSYTGNITFTVMPPNHSAYFSDMATTAWAVPAVDFFRYYGAVTGTTRTGFGPNAGMRRGDFILLLCRAFSLPDVGTASYADVPEDKYYAAAIASAKALGILGGSSSGKFNPEGIITRQDAALYLYRAMNRSGSITPGSAADLAVFRDSASVSSYAVEAMGALARLGVFQGDSGRLYPARALSRAETIVILYRALT